MPLASETASSSKQALSCESHFERHRPTLQPKPHPILVRPPSAPNGLTRRGITSKNTFHRGRRDAIATGLCLSSPWMEMLVFAAMPALYGGARKPSSNFHAGHEACPCLLSIQYMVTSPPTAFGQLYSLRNQRTRISKSVNETLNFCLGACGNDKRVILSMECENNLQCDAVHIRMIYVSLQCSIEYRWQLS